MTAPYRPISLFLLLGSTAAMAVPPLATPPALGEERPGLHSNPIDAYMGANRLPALEQQLSRMSPRAAGAPIPIAHADEDLNHLFAKIEETHPNPFGSFPELDTFDALRRWGHDAVQRLSKDGFISTLDFLYILRCCAASFADGHTRMETWWDGSLERHFRNTATFPPFILASVDGHWVAKTATKELQALLGQPIARIQGQPLEPFLRPAFLAISAEGRGFRDAQLEGASDALFQLSGLFDGSDSVEVTLEDGRSFQAPVLHGGAYQALSKGAPPLTGKSSFRMLSPRTDYFDYRTFDASRSGMNLIQAAFRHAIDKGAENLIIDLRHNSGGNSNAGEEMIRYFWKRPYRMVRRIIVRDHGYAVHDVEEEPPRPTPLWFRGRLFVLTSPETYSSASLFTGAVKAYRMGTLLGYETGGLWSHHGNVRTMNLPRSGYPFGISFKTFYGPKEIPDEFRRGTVPDVPASEAVLAPYAKEPDPLLAWALAVIEGGPQ